MTETLAFSSLGVIFSVLTSFLLFWNLFCQPKNFIRPSFVFVLAYHLIIQWPGTYILLSTPNEIANLLVFLLLSNLFPVCILLVAPTLFRGQIESVWDNIAYQPDSQEKRKVLLVATSFFLGGLLMIGIYLQYVSFTSLGLYVALTSSGDAAAIAAARESSLKLLPALPKYAFAIFSSTLAPLTVALFLVTFSGLSARRKVSSSQKVWQLKIATVLFD